VLDARLGQLGRAVVGFERARDRAERIGAQPWVDRIERDRKRLCPAR
jgi:hypothetical protein